MTRAPGMLDAALAYVRNGFRVFPLGVRSKVPMIAADDGGHGCLDATTDERQVREWLGRWPSANIGVACGPKSDLIVFDMDGDEGRASLAALEAKHGVLPVTRRVRSGREDGGDHLWFRWPAGLDKTHKTCGAHLDILGVGKYVVGPPSVHPTGRRYTADRAPLADLPAAVVEAIRARPPASTGFRSDPIPVGIGTAYGMTALRRASDDLAHEKAGGRNHGLNAAAYSLARLEAAGHLSAQDIEEALVAASFTNGYAEEAGEKSVRAVIASGMEAGRAAGPRGPSLPWARREVAR